MLFTGPAINTLTKGPVSVSFLLTDMETVLDLEALLYHWYVSKITTGFTVIR